MVIGCYGAKFEWKFNRFIALAGLFSMGTIFLVISLNYYVIDIVIFGYMIIYNISMLYLVIFLVSQLNMYNIDQTVSVGYLTNNMLLIISLLNGVFFVKLYLIYFTQPAPLQIQVIKKIKFITYLQYFSNLS